LKGGQLCNHFPNNQELTTKAGLARNLLRLSDYECNSESWFPRCYDFTEESQIELFVQDFQKTTIVNFVKRHAKYFKQHHKEELKRVRNDRKNVYKSIYLPRKDGGNNVVNVMILKAAIGFLQYQIKLRRELLKENECNKWKNSFDLLNKLRYPPYTSNELKELILILPEGWTCPNLYLEHKTISILKKYNAAYPQSMIDGVENVWVVKPSFTSRGIGVYCINAPKEEFFSEKKIQAKVVQKYIEKTFLLKLPGSKSKLENRKFDIRQWVLVTSINPLVIYMFNSCYLKICGSEFSLENFKDKYRHISNFSIQKNNNRINDINNDLIMSVPQFVEHLRTQFDINLDWETDMIPKLAKIIKQTVYSGWDVVEHKSNSFELYGFDFVLDHKLNPWLIEVNLSPACSERTG
jgi:tubulin monoglycylase TTLL3/8